MIRKALPTEGLLRPIGEWFVVFNCYAAAVLSLYAYEYLFMSKTLSFFSSGFFLYVGTLYLKDGLRLKRYQRNIRRLRHYAIEPKNIPYSSAYVLLGRGFRWLPIHTQRLKDTGKAVNKQYVTDSGLYTKVRDFCLKNADIKELSWLVRILNINSEWNPFRPLPDIGGNPAIHGIEPDEKDHRFRTVEREGHTGILGTTGVGKTRLAELIIAADIRAGAKKITKAAVESFSPAVVFKTAFIAFIAAVVLYFTSVISGFWTHEKSVALVSSIGFPGGGGVAYYMAIGVGALFVVFFSLLSCFSYLSGFVGTPALNANGNVVVVIDPKGDGELLKRCVAECIRTGRIDDFYMFHLGFPALSCEYNPVGDYQKITEVAGRATNQLAGDGSSAVFKEFSWRFVNIVAQACERVGEEPTYERISMYVSNPELILSKYLDRVFCEKGDPDWMQTVYQVSADIDDKAASFAGRPKDVLALTQFAKSEVEESGDPIIRGLVNSLEYSKTYYDKIVASLLPFLDKMNTGSSKELLSPGLKPKKGRRRFRWRDAISRRAVIYVGLDALTDPVVAVAVASAMLSDLCSVAGDIYKHGAVFDEPKYRKAKPVPIILHLDEFNELITGDEIIQILNKARGAGVMCNVYSQTIKDIEAKIGSAAKAGQIIGNLQNLIMMRVRDDQTAELLINQLPTVEVNSNTEVSGTKDNGELSSFSTDNADRSTEKEQPMLAISDITMLPKGQAFIYKNGGELHKIRIPLILADDICLPDEVEEMAAVMKKNYQTSDNWGERLSA